MPPTLPLYRLGSFPGCSRLKRQAMTRFKVLGLDRDRELIRSLAKRLAVNDTQANEIRMQVSESVAPSAKRGRILATLRRSPLVGVDLEISRTIDSGREIDL